MRRVIILGSTGSIGSRPSTWSSAATSSRWSASPRATRLRAVVAQASSTASSRIALADEAAAARASEAWTGGTVLAGAEGLVELITDTELRPGPERARRLRRARPDGRGARRGHRPRARQQGVARRGRRAGDGAGRGHRRAGDPGRLRALGALPAGRRRGAAGHRRPARADRVRRPVPRQAQRRAQGRHRRAGARPPDLGHGRQDHDRLGHADEQGPRGDRGAPPVRRAATTGSTWSCTRSRSSTR